MNCHLEFEPTLSSTTFKDIGGYCSSIEVSSIQRFSDELFAWATSIHCILEKARERKAVVLDSCMSHGVVFTPITTPLKGSSDFGSNIKKSEKKNDLIDLSLPFNNP